MKNIIITTNIVIFSIFLIFSYTGDTPAEENGIRIGLPTLPTTLGSPFSGFSLPSALPLDAVFDGLTIIDEHGATQPGLALSWQAETPNRWIFYLKKKVKFSNGEIFDASAIEETIKILLSKEASNTSLGTTINRLGIINAKKRDDLTIEILTQTNDVLIPQYMSALRILAPKALKRKGLQAFTRSPIGTGPFKPLSWSEGRIVMTSFSESWRKPKLKKIEFIKLPDSASRLQGLISGSLDIALGLSPEDNRMIKDSGGRLWIRKEPGTNFLAFVTTKDSPLKNVNIRIALNHAVNKQKIIDTFFQGAVKAEGQIAHSMSFGYNPNIEAYEYDPIKAKRLLQDEGYPDGFTLPILLIPGGNAHSQDWYQQIASDLSKININMEIRPATLPKYLDYLYNGGWPSLGFAMTAFTFDPLAAYRIRSCSWKHPYHCDQKIMPLIRKARNAKTLDERRTLTRNVLSHEHNNPPGIFLWQSTSFEGLGPRIKNYWSGADTINVEDITLKNGK